MEILLACTIGFFLDLCVGDPACLYHPVRLIGALIAWLEKAVRKICSREKALLVGGGILWTVVVFLSGLIPFLLLWAVNLIHPILRFLLETFWCMQLLAAKSLKTESMKVYERLKQQDLSGARKAVSMIVGRDTENLTESGVTKAAVETVAENTSDGVVAPLLFLMLGGAPLGFVYKAVNTMDSMLGYKNEKYHAIGFGPAKMDDIFNFIPARISALLMITAAWMMHMDVRQAWHVFRRDRYKHTSPNSAQTESVCAGALNIQLAGDAYYFGKLHHKETIGDALRPVKNEDIVAANRLMYGTAWLALLLFGVVRLLLVL